MNKFERKFLRFFRTINPSILSNENPIIISSLRIRFCSQTVPSQPPRRDFLRKHTTSTRLALEPVTLSPGSITIEALDSTRPQPKRLNRSFSRNISLHYCHNYPNDQAINRLSSIRTEFGELINTEHSIIEGKSSRPLVLLCCWMLAKEKHIKKYRVFWFERGFDVLTVRTPPSALLLPGIGGKKNASNIIDALINHRPFYDKILVHTLSVGDDEVSNVQINHSLHETWRSKNILTDYICWNHSTHVLHFKEHENEYRTKVDEFVSKLAL
ncbi:hypothetical protein QR98_0040850 [Sarcoptes scabiei]|uniref:Uncharacterized protein n=1 Tax=Sarcoptes scabiei TaxID=52283 RepID=A0A132A427_SARSC|nr:hypothetical protein QR98_0040850 [Sarcoptes scabiei]